MLSLQETAAGRNRQLRSFWYLRLWDNTLPILQIKHHQISHVFLLYSSLWASYTAHLTFISIYKMHEKINLNPSKTRMWFCIWTPLWSAETNYTGVQRLSNAQVTHQGWGEGCDIPLPSHPHQDWHLSKVSSEYGKSLEVCELLQMARLTFFQSFAINKLYLP